MEENTKKKKRKRAEKQEKDKREKGSEGEGRQGYKKMWPPYCDILTIGNQIIPSLPIPASLNGWWVEREEGADEGNMDGRMSREQEEEEERDKRESGRQGRIAIIGKI